MIVLRRFGYNHTKAVRSKLHYVVSDIHGEFDRYQVLLEYIDFSNDDTLYVLGDAIDRGSRGVDVLKDIMHRSSVVMLLGNHELMCLNVMDSRSVPNARELWVKYNGGSVTRRALLYKTGHSERVAILRWMRALPDHLDIDVDDRAFHLVHAFPADNLHDRLWTRPHYNTPDPFGGDRTVIIGHTVVAGLQPDQSAAAYIDVLDLKKDQPTGILTRGEVGRILTNSPTHPRGIKVMLTYGRVGRVQVIVDSETN